MFKLVTGGMRVLAKLFRLPRPAVDPDSRFAPDENGYHEAEEARFQHIADEDASFNKPFNEVKLAPLHLYRLGLTLSALELGPQDVVLDFGAGTCWLSAMLNRMDVKTVSLDISATAIELGRRSFALDRRQRLDLDPEFCTYDGHHLPFDDGRFDAIICYDSFHHLANQEEILREMYRVTGKHGRVVFCEPLRGHRTDALSVLEMEAFGVLERDIDLPALEKTARRIGFEELVLKPYAQTPDDELVGNSLLNNLAFSMKEAGKRYLEHYSVFYLKKGTSGVFDSNHPGRLAAEVKLPVDTWTVDPGELRSLSVEVVNVGDTTWLAESHPRGGYVTLGCQHLDGDRRLVDRDFRRFELAENVLPGSSWSENLEIAVPQQPGVHFLKFDMVDERLCWFEERGSQPALLEVRVNA